MNNAEAIIIAVQKWMDNNKEFVGQCFMKGAENAAAGIAESVGIMVSARVGKFINDNKNDFVAAISTQIAIGILERDREIVVPEQTPKEPIDGNS